MSEKRLEAQVLDWLLDADQTVATAESATGGDIVARLTRTPGAGQAVLGGAVVYTEQTKQCFLQLTAEEIEEHGEVGIEITKALASAVRRITGADWGLAVTGVAGPGRVHDLPVGYSVWALSHPDGTMEAYDQVFAGDRAEVVAQLGTAALTLLRRRLAT